MKNCGSFDYDMAVIGLGYVGLPLVTTAAQSGLKCLGIDINKDIINALRLGASHIDRVSESVLSANSDRLDFECTFSPVVNAAVVVLCVPTPLKGGKPYTKYIESAVTQVSKRIRNGQLLILESTTYPQHSLEIAKEIEQQSGLTVGEDFFVCFSPEREDPGNQEWITKTIPKLVGGVTEKCGQNGYEFYDAFLDTVIRTKSSTAAELSKLLENAQRLINISFINEFKIICEELGEDVNHIIDLACTKPFGFTEYRPGPGVGGHCIPIDPFYLQWKYLQFNSESYLISAAKLAEDRNREIVLRKLNGHMVQAGVDPSDVLYVGLSYKANVSDVRSSVAYEIAVQLNKEHKGITFYDPLVRSEDVDGIKVTTTLEGLWGKFSTVIIMVDHDQIDFLKVVKDAAHVFDAKNILSKKGIAKEFTPL